MFIQVKIIKHFVENCLCCSEASLNAELGILKKNVEAKNEQYMIAAAELVRKSISTQEPITSQDKKIRT